MSDVEDYPYSPYDDLEDILWDADPAPELADDLAGHAIHSPVYQEEDAVKNELQEYFSDWEYYSDDYMDDDPALLRRNPQDGGPLELKDTVKRGKKRKLVETQDIPSLDLDEDRLLTRCIQGTIWAKPSDLKTPHYKNGQEKKVALMKDWKIVSAFKENGWGRSTSKEDESWANNMSLADMGLRNVVTQSSFEQDAQPAETEADFVEEEDGEGEGDQEDEDEEEVGDLPERVQAEIVFSKDMPIPAAGSSRLRNAMLLEEDDGGGQTTQVLPEPEEDDDAPRKRRRVKPDLPSPPDSNEAVIPDTKVSQARSKMKNAAPPHKDAFTVNSDNIMQSKGSMSLAPDMQQNKKRKATEELEDAATRSTASSRGKRVASSAERNNPSTPRPSRTTRSTKAK